MDNMTNSLILKFNDMQNVHMFIDDQNVSMIEVKPLDNIT